MMLMGSLCAVSHAKNLGHYGQVFPVIEEDLRQLIMNRLKAMDASGALLAHQRLIETRVASHIIRPKPLMLPSTKTPETFQVNPTVTVSQDLFAPDGSLIVTKGTLINPFSHIHYSKTLFFFNADDKKQSAWVKKHYGEYEHVKFILTGGDVRDASEIFGRIYFDLNGTLAERFQLKHVPSIVTQKGLVWNIKEIGAQDE